VSHAWLEFWSLDDTPVDAVEYVDTAVHMKSNITGVTGVLPVLPVKIWSVLIDCAVCSVWSGTRIKIKIMY